MNIIFYVEKLLSIFSFVFKYVFRMQKDSGFFFEKSRSFVPVTQQSKPNEKTKQTQTMSQPDSQ